MADKQIRITFDPDNLNLHTARGMDLLGQSIEETGTGRSILLDGEGGVIAGNATLQTFSERLEKPVEELIILEYGQPGHEEADVVYTRSTGKQLGAIMREDIGADDDLRTKIAIYDNRTGEVNLMWSEQLKDAWKRLQLDSAFSKQEIKRAVERHKRPIRPHELRKNTTRDKVEELRKKWQTDVGQIWQIGPHRLYIADSTGDAVTFEDEKFNLLFTSPPYWLGRDDYEAEETEEEIDSFIHAVAGNMAEWIAPEEARIVINTSTSSIHRLEKKRKVEVLPVFDKWIAALKHHGWLLRHMRLWVRNDMPYRFAGTGVAPEQDMAHIKNFEHIGIFTAEEQIEVLTTFLEMDDEIIAAAFREYAQALEESEVDTFDMRAAFAYILTFYTPDVTQRGQERVGEPWASTVTWNDIVGKAGADDHHTAAMSPEIASRFIQLYSKEGEIILDPFFGSGTTAIQAHRWQRVCYGIERSPEYAAGALERMTAMLGLQAKRID